MFFLDISRTLPLDATAGYAKVAKLASEEVGAVTELTPESLQNLSYIYYKSAEHLLQQSFFQFFPRS